MRKTDTYVRRVVHEIYQDCGPSPQTHSCIFQDLSVILVLYIFVLDAFHQYQRGHWEHRMLQQQNETS